jgi:pimeloyl-ACP methyl ester carboxylesterase
MARAVAAEPLFCAFAGIAGYYAQATERSINAAAPAIARAREAEKRWRETGVEETVPAVAADNGDVAMPLAEAFAYYGTPRGAVPNYVNGFAVQSWAYTSTFDAIGAAKLITVPTMVIHSERALAPSQARRFQADLNNARILWVESSGQIDFYDDPRLIAIGADAVARFFTAATL